MDYRVGQAAREDAFVVAAMQLQADLAAGGTNRAGFLTEYADAWLARFDEHPTWLARTGDGTAVGAVVTRCERRLPSLGRPVTAAMHVVNVFVRPADRGHGLAERMLRQALEWGDAHGVTRYSLNAVPAARSLYERLGFGAPDHRWMELRRPWDLGQSTGSQSSSGI